MQVCLANLNVLQIYQFEIFFILSAYSTVVDFVNVLHFYTRINI